MVWNPTATTLTWPPVSFSQSGARRWRGSATCGPLKVRMLTLMPLNFVPCEAAGDALAASEAAAEAAAEAAVDAAGAWDAGVALHADRTSTKPTAGAIDLNRDTGFLLLTAFRSSNILNDRR